MLDFLQLAIIFSLAFIFPIPAVRALLLFGRKIIGKNNFWIFPTLSWISLGAIIIAFVFTFPQYVFYKAVSLELGLALALFSIILFSWAERHVSFQRTIDFEIRKQRPKLIQSGPYRWIRHPRYLALILFSFAVFLMSPAVITTGIFFYTLLTHICFARIEEMELEKYLPEYKKYKKRVPAWMPIRNPSR